MSNSVTKAATNRRNAARSTGPKTAEGKQAARLNGLKHGLRSDSPVLPGESSEAWQTHCDAIVGALAPSGLLEEELARRVALCLWRLRRVTAFEAGVVGADVADALDAPLGTVDLPLSAAFQPDPLAEVKQKLAISRLGLTNWSETLTLLTDLPSLPDDAPVCSDDVEGLLSDVDAHLDHGGTLDVYNTRFLSELGVPANHLSDPWEWEGWTAGVVRRAVETIARRGKADPAAVLALAQESRRQWVAGQQREIKALEVEIARLERQAVRKKERAVSRAFLLDARLAEKVMRYESHLGRQMLQALHTLERLQKGRQGEPVPPPIAVDVSVDA